MVTKTYIWPSSQTKFRKPNQHHHNTAIWKNTRLQVFQSHLLHGMFAKSSVFQDSQTLGFIKLMKRRCTSLTNYKPKQYIFATETQPDYPKLIKQLVYICFKSRKALRCKIFAKWWSCRNHFSIISRWCRCGHLNHLYSRCHWHSLISCMQL